MPDGFLHDHPDFKDLLETVSRDEKINEPSLVEKDYWIMHALWGLTEQPFNFELKGGTSLSKGYQLIHRFSEDIDIRIDPPKRMTVKVGRNQNDLKHVDSRRDYFDWLAEEISIPGIVDVVRDTTFDDKKCRNGGIRLKYESHFSPIKALKDGILLEVGFDQTKPNDPLEISSWAYERGATVLVDLIDNRAIDIKCYLPEYTFVEKIQTVVKNYRQFKETGTMKPNFLRHYYDIYMLLKCKRVINFIGTAAYHKHKDARIKGKDKAFGIRPAFEIMESQFEKEYERTKGIYYSGQIELSDIIKGIKPFLDQL